MGSALCNCLDTVPDWAVRFRPGCLPRIPLPSTRLGSRGRQAPHPPDISEATLTLTRQPITRSLVCNRLWPRSEEHTSELQSQSNLVCRLLLEKKKKIL